MEERQLKELDFKLGEHLDISNLNGEQVAHIKKEFDYLMWLSYLEDDEVNQEKKEALQLYMHAYYMRIAVLIDCFEKRNKLVELGVIQ